MSLSGKSASSRFTEIVSEFSSVLQIDPTDVKTDPIFLKKYAVTNPDSQYILFGLIQCVALGKRFSGVGNVTIQFATSIDNGVTWDDLAGGVGKLSFSGAGYSSNGSSFSNPNNDVLNNITHLAIIAYNSDGATSGQIKKSKFLWQIFVPNGAKLTQV